MDLQTQLCHMCTVKAFYSTNFDTCTTASTQLECTVILHFTKVKLTQSQARLYYGTMWWCGRFCHQSKMKGRLWSSLGDLYYRGRVWIKARRAWTLDQWRSLTACKQYHCPLCMHMVSISTSFDHQYMEPHARSDLWITGSFKYLVCFFRCVH